MDFTWDRIVRTDFTQAKTEEEKKEQKRVAHFTWSHI
jgi:hypothetical protein